MACVQDMVDTGEVKLNGLKETVDLCHLQAVQSTLVDVLMRVWPIAQPMRRINAD